MSKRLVTDSQAKQLAELYVWDIVVGVLSGSSAPRTKHGHAAAKKVIAICEAQGRRLIKAYDSAAKVA